VRDSHTEMTEAMRAAFIADERWIRRERNTDGIFSAVQSGQNALVQKNSKYLGQIACLRREPATMILSHARKRSALSMVHRDCIDPLARIVSKSQLESASALNPST
jgi:hypothetical protein